ncbi:MAG: hypothetical protein WC997_09135 [Porticoccaceae bacterium]
MEKPAARIMYAVGESFFLALCTLLPTLFIFVDVVVMGHQVSESSLTEHAQVILLFVSALLFLLHSWRHLGSRGFCLLVSGFFGCMLIREVDGYLDLVWHGFWVWPANLLAIVTILYVALCCRNTVLVPMAAFINTKPYFHIVFGLLIVMVFSRTFGSGTLLWEPLLGEDYEYIFKSALQEGLELLGYIFISYGSYCFLRRAESETFVAE